MPPSSLWQFLVQQLHSSIYHTAPPLCGYATVSVLNNTSVMAKLRFAPPPLPAAGYATVVQYIVAVTKCNWESGIGRGARQCMDPRWLAWLGRFSHLSICGANII